jgi:hypothetical protein
VSVIYLERIAKQRKRGIDEEGTDKMRKESSGFHLGIVTQVTTCDSRPSLEYANTSKKEKIEMCYPIG